MNVRAWLSWQLWRVCVRQAGAKGLGEFLREGVVLEEGTHVMQYDGRESYKDPRKDYTMRNRRVTHNSPKIHFCMMMLIVFFSLVLIDWFL